MELQGNKVDVEHREQLERLDQPVLSVALVLLDP